MVNLSVVVGRVVEVVHTDRADFLIVHDNSNPKYPTNVACEFYGDRNRPLIEGVGQHELVKVEGTARSREHNGKWFTTFSAFRVTRIDETSGINLPPKALPPGNDIPF